MENQRKDFVKIIEKSYSITERLSNSFISNELHKEDFTTNYYLEKWCQVVAQGDWKKFTKRLAWDGLEIQEVRHILENVCIADFQSLPNWAETLKLAMQAAVEIPLESLAIHKSGKQVCLNSKDPIPFEEFCLPFIHVAQEKLLNLLGSSYSLLTEIAHANIERHLLWRLSNICSRTLQFEFDIFCDLNQPSLNRYIDNLSSNPGKNKYQTFIKRLLTVGLLEFFQEYSVLARLMATTTDLWVEANREFICRLESDWLALQQTFGENFHQETQAKPLRQVTHVNPSVSDMHNGGRTVVALTFDSGLKLIYKPRDLSIEVAYFQLLDWLNQQDGNPLPFKIINVLNRSTHGWVEYVEHLPCKNIVALQRYYQRAGILLCLIYALGGTDFHYENLIANDEHPVLIDLETLMQPQVRYEKETTDGISVLTEWTEAQTLANQQFENSVLQSSLLPSWQVGSNGGGAYDTSALGGIDEQDLPVRLPQWQNINTDNMVMSFVSGKMSPKANSPHPEESGLPLSDYVEDIVKGFWQFYQFLINQRDKILAANGPLVPFAHLPVRFLFRPTKVYGSVLSQTFSPEALRDGCTRSIQLDILSRCFLSLESKPIFWPLLRAEHQAIEQLDIPLFFIYSHSDSLILYSQEADSITREKIIVEKCFEQSSYSRAISRLSQLSETDLAQQISLIKGALYIRSTNQVYQRNSPNTLKLNLTDTALLTLQESVRQAVAIAQKIGQGAIHSSDGKSATWIGISYLPSAQRLNLQPLGFSLYDGTCGIALFLTALEKITGGAGFRDLTLAVLQPLYQYVQTPESVKNLGKSTGIGGCKGLGSIIYTLVRLYQLFTIDNSPESINSSAIIIDYAKQISYLLTPELIASDQKFDVIAGSAGAILGLLALHKATPSNTKQYSSPLELARACGNHLLNYCTPSDSGLCSWATLDKKLLTGFSHGAAGIAYALLRLYQVTGETPFLEAAQEAIAYERSVFIPEEGNWPDFRQSAPKERPTCMCSWCHGAPGIGLARVATLDILDTPEIRQDIEAAINTTKQHGLSEIDHLCCGNMGRIEFLFTAGRKLSRPDLVEEAMKQAAQVVARAQQRGHFAYGSILDFHPGFFQGAAGIGYELLRLAYPDQLPSVLLWE
jgi:type 2 lantibiotic biosynthesis protein LanM